MSDSLALKHSIQLNKIVDRLNNIEERLDKIELVTDDVKKFCDMVEEEDKQYSKMRKST